MKMSKLKRMTKQQLIDMIVQCDENIGAFGLEEEEELPVCEHRGSILAHPCDCQVYKEE